MHLAFIHFAAHRNTSEASWKLPVFQRWRLLALFDQSSPQLRGGKTPTHTTSCPAYASPGSVFMEGNLWKES